MTPPSPNDTRSPARTDTTPVRVALLDLYDGESNLGMGALRSHLAAADGRHDGRPLQVDSFDVRQERTLPGLDHDIYISSGGPGSPFVGQDEDWEAPYFDWLTALWAHNQDAPPEERKHALFICYSFQLMARHFEFGAVTKRAERSFGVVSLHKTDAGRTDPLLRSLPDPFWAADFRGWQVVRPASDRLDALGGAVLAWEDSPSEDDTANPGATDRAVMAVRLSSEIVGVQFHPEADPDGMLTHLQHPDRRATVIDRHGQTKYERLLRRLRTMNELRQTHATVVPTFLRRAIESAKVPPAA